MYEATGTRDWEDRAHQLRKILCGIQQTDGGFDIGYDFSFGHMHKAGQSTSPELVGLVALCEYARLFGSSEVEIAARKAAEWIRMHALDMGNGLVAIPYSPHTIKEVMVYNGTSFACGALGCYLGQFGGDDHLAHLYSGMIRYLDSVLTIDEKLPGRFWYYSDQSREDLDILQRAKIDYYHQMQQIEMHAIAQTYKPDTLQLAFIRDCAEHVLDIRKSKSVVPYTNDNRYFKGEIHLWGLCSVASGLLEAAKHCEDRAVAYRNTAEETLEWIVRNGWNGQSFEAVLKDNGDRITPRRYMVRSDAWVFNSLAAATKHFDSDRWLKTADECFRKMESVHFSGPENHASNTRKRIAGAIAQKLKSMLSRS
ncbi:MAG: hypothetical protein AAF483_12385 [Planctomycetota bacterium]